MLQGFTVASHAPGKTNIFMLLEETSKPMKGKGDVVSRSNFWHNCQSLQQEQVCWLCCSAADKLLQSRGFEQPLSTLLHFWCYSLWGSVRVFSCFALLG